MERAVSWWLNGGLNGFDEEDKKGEKKLTTNENWLIRLKFDRHKSSSQLTKLSRETKTKVQTA